MKSSALPQLQTLWATYSLPKIKQFKGKKSSETIVFFNIF